MRTIKYLLLGPLSGQKARTGRDMRTGNRAASFRCCFFGSSTHVPQPGFAVAASAALPLRAIVRAEGISRLIVALLRRRLPRAVRRIGTDVLADASTPFDRNRARPLIVFFLRSPYSKPQRFTEAVERELS
jgi:hypothetical protein